MKKTPLIFLLICSFWACNNEPSASSDKSIANPPAESKTQAQTKAFIQSDSVLMGEKIMPDGSIRKDNFHLDKHASPEELVRLYRAYDVYEMSPSDNIYLVKTKKLYAKARTFFRMIRFDEKGNQLAARTFVDYVLGGFIRMGEGDYCILLKLAAGGEAGPDWGEKGSSFQLLYLDENFKTVHQKQPCGSQHNEVERFFMEQDTIRMSVVVNMGCTMCEDEKWSCSLKFGPKGAFYGGRKGAKSVYPDADSVLFEQIVGCLSE